MKEKMFPKWKIHIPTLEMVRRRSLLFRPAAFGETRFYDRKVVYRRYKFGGSDE